MPDQEYGVFNPDAFGDLFSNREPVYKPLDFGVPSVLSRIGEADKKNQTRTISSPTPASDLDADLYDMFKPETRAQEEYYKMIQNMPKREEPGIGTRILAGLSTLGQGGLKQAENVKYSKYNRELTDYNTRANMLKELADMERTGNTNNRMLLNSALTERRFDRRQSEIERHNRETGEQSAGRLRLQQWKAANPDSKFVRLANGNYGVADPQTGAITDSGVKYGLSPLEDIMLERETTAQRQAGQNEFNVQMENLRQQHRLETQRLEQQLKEALDRDKPLTPEQQKVAQYLRAQEVFNSDPDVKKFLTLGEPGTNTFMVKLPNSLPEWTGYGAEQRRANAQKWIDVNQRIYGKSWTPPKNIADIANPPNAPVKSTPSARPANVPPNYIKVKKGNQTGWIDPKQFDAKSMQKVP